jgi:hypothetical protein
MRKNDSNFNNKKNEVQSITKNNGGAWESAKDVEDKNKEKKKSTSWDKSEKNERSNSWDNNDKNEKKGIEKMEKKGSVVNVKNMADDRDYDDRDGRGRGDREMDDERNRDRGRGVGRDDNASQRGVKRSSSPSKSNRYYFSYLYVYRLVLMSIADIWSCLYMYVYNIRSIYVDTYMNMYVYTCVKIYMYTSV